MDKYNVLSRIGEGAHGVVLKARHTKTGELVALKKIPLRKLDDGISNTCLREIKALQHVSIHPNIVKLREVFPHGLGFVLVFDYMYTDLSEVLRNSESPLSEGKVKSYMLMLLKGVSFMHSVNIMHRDLKPANLLIDSKGVLKIADFGLARIFTNEENRLYSHQVATRWYRAPELLYGSRKYAESVDLWAVGCIFGELINNSPLFPGENDIEQLWFVIRVLGTPTREIWPEMESLPDYDKISFTSCKSVPFEDFLVSSSPLAMDLLQSFLRYEPSKRISAANALLHNYFLTEPLPSHHSELPRLSNSRSGPTPVYTNYEACLKVPLAALVIDQSFLNETAFFSSYIKKNNAD